MASHPTPGYVGFRGHTGPAYNEAALRHFLALDWRRARRSAHALLVVLVSIRERPGVNGILRKAQARAVFEGLAGAIREIDFVGWFDEGRVAAAVLPLRSADPSGSRQVVHARIQRSVARRLPRALESSLRVRVVSLGGPRSRPASAAAGGATGGADTALSRHDPDLRRGWTFPGPLSSALFWDTVTRERRRAERFSESVAVAQVAPIASPGTFDMRRLLHIADVMGWVRPASSLGFLRSLDTAAAQAEATTLRASVEDAARHGDRGTSAPVTVQLETYEPGVDGPVRAIEPGVARRLAQAAHTGTKRLIDIVGSTLCLVLLAPVLIGLALLVKLSSEGPVLFRQQRIGKGGRLFTMLKFRTMRANADHDLHEQFVDRFIGSDDAPAQHAPRPYKIVDDPRVTPLGRFLRRSSLDELPQLWNVLRGEMSLVGPRPAVPYEVARYKLWHLRRVTEVKPGMTGLWQVTGRSATTFNDMVRLDIQYVRNHTLWVDLKILLATPRAVLSGAGAH